MGQRLEGDALLLKRLNSVFQNHVRSLFVLILEPWVRLEYSTGYPSESSHASPGSYGTWKRPKVRDWVSSSRSQSRGFFMNGPKKSNIRLWNTNVCNPDQHVCLDQYHKSWNRWLMKWHSSLPSSINTLCFTSSLVLLSLRRDSAGLKMQMQRCPFETFFLYRHKCKNKMCCEFSMIQCFHLEYIYA